MTLPAVKFRAVLVGLLLKVTVKALARLNSAVEDKPGTPPAQLAATLNVPSAPCVQVLVCEKAFLQTPIDAIAQSIAYRMLRFDMTPPVPTEGCVCVHSKQGEGATQAFLNKIVLEKTGRRGPQSTPG